MLYTKTQLEQWISLPSDYETLKTKLIAKVFEIEHGEIQRTLPKLLVLGKVLSVEKHPNADTLNICQLECGSLGQFQICTGGENVATGQYVPVILPGGYLPAIDLHIEPRKLRGEDSNGMICSKGELGINEDGDKHWIWDLGADIACTDDMIGKDLMELFPRMLNTIFEVESVAITNRPDLWGHFGLAVECRSVFSDYQTMPNKIDEEIKQIQDFDPEKLSHSYGNKALKHSSIKTNKCRFYSTLKVGNTINTTGTFQERLSLLDLGHATRFNRVDYGNQFMSNYGQPVHVFDADKVSGAISVTESKDGELFVDLMDKEHKLIAGDIIICDEEKILALAGIIGGASSAISIDTTNILIETANFEPIQIRKTSSRLGLRTEASMRFEKGINPLWTMYCARAQIEITDKSHQDHASGEVSGFDFTTGEEFQNTQLSLDLYKATNYFYGSYDKDIEAQIRPILKALGYGIHETTNDLLSIQAPIRRADITMIQDVYEDIARHIGLEHIPEVSSPVMVSKSPASFLSFTYNIAEKLISGLGLNQVESYPWYSEERINILGLDKNTHYELVNPSDSATPYMAQTLLPGLLEIAKKNYRQVLPIKVFEIGKVFNMLDNKPSETKMLAGIRVEKKSQSRELDTYLLIKQVLQLIEASYQTPAISFKASYLSNFHPNKQAQILIDNEVIGFIGEVHPSLLDTIKIGSEYSTSYIAIELEKLFAFTHKKGSIGYASLQDQVISRDLSFEVDNTVHFDTIIQTISNHTQVSDYHIFDLYQKENRKSISINIDIIGDGSTTIDQINVILADIIRQVEATGAVLKGAKL